MAETIKTPAAKVPKPVQVNLWHTCRSCGYPKGGWISCRTFMKDEDMVIEIEPHYCKDNVIMPGHTVTVRQVG